jgi:hypothetical protein
LCDIVGRVNYGSLQCTWNVSGMEESKKCVQNFSGEYMLGDEGADGYILLKCIFRS